MSRRDCALRAHFPELRLSRQERSAFERCVSCIHCSTTAPGALTRPSTRDATRRSATATLPPCRTASRPVCVLAALQSARANCARQPPVRAALTQSTLPPALWTDRLFPHGRYQCCCSQPVQRLRLVSDAACGRAAPHEAAQRWLGRCARAHRPTCSTALHRTPGCPIDQDQSNLVARRAPHRSHGIRTHRQPPTLELLHISESSRRRAGAAACTRHVDELSRYPLACA